MTKPVGPEHHSKATRSPRPPPAAKDHTVPIASSSQPSASPSVRRMERSKAIICLGSSS